MKKIILIFLFLFCSFKLVWAEKKIKTIIEGNINSKIKLIVYESLTCIHCANFHKNVYPLLKENFIDSGLANLEFRSYPLDMAALNASKIAHCNNDGDSKILHFLYLNQNQWLKGETIEDINKNLKISLINENIALDFEKCIKDKAVEDHILEDRINGAKKYKINSTPTLIIMGEKFEKPLTYKNIKKALEKLI